MAQQAADNSDERMPTMTSAEVLALVGRYPVVRLIGHGAAGQVFECIDPQSPPPDRDRHVAVRVLGPELASDSGRRQRLRSEGERLKGIPSPYVARCYDLVEHDGEWLLVTELLLGQDLQARLDCQGPLPIKEALRVVRDVTKGLRAAWAVSVVHGDIKPANVFVHEGRVKVVDFGLALPVGSLSSTADAAALLKSTPAFLAPELVWGGSPDVRSDFYSLGCTVFALLTGRPPFAHDSTAALLTAHTSEAPPLLTTWLPDASPRLLRLLEALLAKSPRERPATHDDCLALIEDALADVVGAPSLSPSLSPSMAVTLPTVAKHVPAMDGPAAAPSTAALAPSSAAPSSSTAPSPSPMPVAAAAMPLQPRASARSTSPGDPFAAVDDAEAITVGAPTGVVGSLKQMNVAEIVQSLELGRKTAIVEVHPTRGDKGTLACIGGAVVDARTARLVGEDAFYELITQTDGVFRIHYGDEPAEKTISKPTQFLVLEGLRRSDERNFDAHTVREPIAVSSPFLQPPLTSPTGAPGAASGFDMDSATLALPTMTARQTNDAPHGHQGLEEATEPGGHHAPARPRAATTPPTAGRAAPGIADLVADLREVLGGAGIAVTTAWAQLVTRGVRALRPRLATRPGLVIALERATPSLQSPLALVGAALLAVAVILAVAVALPEPAATVLPRSSRSG